MRLYGIGAGTRHGPRRRAAAPGETHETQSCVKPQQSKARPVGQRSRELSPGRAPDYGRRRRWRCCGAAKSGDMKKEADPAMPRFGSERGVRAGPSSATGRPWLVIVKHSPCRASTWPRRDMECRLRGQAHGLHFERLVRQLQVLLVRVHRDRGAVAAWRYPRAHPYCR